MPSIVSADPLLLQNCATVGEQGWGMRTLFFLLSVFLVLLSIAALIIVNNKRELLPQAGVGLHSKGGWNVPQMKYWLEPVKRLDLV